VQVNTIDRPPIYFLGLPTYLRATAATTNGAFGRTYQIDSLRPLPEESGGRTS